MLFGGDVGDGHDEVYVQSLVNGPPISQMFSGGIADGESYGPWRQNLVSKDFSKWWPHICCTMILSLKL